MTESANDLRAILKSQYRAAIGMLRQAVERCPDELWLSAEHPNAFWHVAYHAVFVTYVYLQPDFDSFRPWQNHREGSRPHSSICRHSILAGMGKADELAKKWGQ
jgi:hypothetical protein